MFGDMFAIFKCQAIVSFSFLYMYACKCCTLYANGFLLLPFIIKPLSDMNSFHQRRSQHKTIATTTTTTTIYHHPHTIILKHPINSHYVAWHALVRQSSTVANRCTFYRPIRVFPTSNHDGYARLGITFWHYFP